MKKIQFRCNVTGSGNAVHNKRPACQASIIAIILFAATCTVNAERQKVYTLDNMPRVDVHDHLRDRESIRNWANSIKNMGGTLAINLSGSVAMEADMQWIKDELEDRVLIAPGCYNPCGGLPWTVEEIGTHRDRGFCGYKIFDKYQCPLSEAPGIDDALEKMGEEGLPVIGLHVGDPPEYNWNVPDKYMKYQSDAEKVIRRHPNTTIITAHMFWLCCNDSSLDTLIKFLDRTPNLYMDLAAVPPYFDAPQPSYDKLRNFFIKYKDRILFGTDTQGYGEYYDMFETNRNIGNNKRGLNLPLDVLNYIYYYNAARLIPGVKERLEALGYDIGDKPPSLNPDSADAADSLAAIDTTEVDTTGNDIVPVKSSAILHPAAVSTRKSEEAVFDLLGRPLLPVIQSGRQNRSASKLTVYRHCKQNWMR